MDFRHQVLEVLAGQPDLIVASKVNRFKIDGYLADLAPEACTAEYTVRALFRAP